MLSGVHSRVVLFEYSILHRVRICTTKICFYPINHIIFDCIINYRSLFVRSGHSIILIATLTSIFVMWVWVVVLSRISRVIFIWFSIFTNTSWWNLIAFWNKIHMHVTSSITIPVMSVIFNCAPISCSWLMILIISIVIHLIVCINSKLLIRITRININSIYSRDCPAVCYCVSNILEFEYLRWHYTCR